MKATLFKRFSGYFQDHLAAIVATSGSVHALCVGRLAIVVVWGSPPTQQGWIHMHSAARALAQVRGGAHGDVLDPKEYVTQRGTPDDN